jgi:hypothetical protein
MESLICRSVLCLFIKILTHKGSTLQFLKQNKRIKIDIEAKIEERGI